MKLIWKVVFIFLAFLPLSVHGEDVKQHYVGKSDCQPELKWAPGTYGIRLDKQQKAYLKAYTVDRRNIPFIVQFGNDGDQCGVVRDVVQPKDTSSSFVWDCVDKKSPNDVVVGTWPSRHPSVSGPPVEAWRIDLGGLKFVPIHSRIGCYNPSYAGSDDGDDLVVLRKKLPRLAN